MYTPEKRACGRDPVGKPLAAHVMYGPCDSAAIVTKRRPFVGITSSWPSIGTRDSRGSGHWCGGRMLQTLITSLNQLVDRWHEDVERRRLEPGNDAVVAAWHRESDVKDVRELLRSFEAEHEYLTVEEYAEHRDVSPETVRRWLRNRQLPDAHPSGRSYRIHRNSKPLTRRKTDVPAD
jgi:excisionase family DNA binding protein